MPPTSPRWARSSTSRPAVVSGMSRQNASPRVSSASCSVPLLVRPSSWLGSWSTSASTSRPLASEALKAPGAMVSMKSAILASVSNVAA